MGEGHRGDRFLRVVVDLEVDTDPISGTIATDSGPGEGPSSSEPFTGLMQLVAALDRMRGGAANDAAPSADGGSAACESI